MMSQELEMRHPCGKCGATVGVWSVSAHNRPVRCIECHTFWYHANRLETGEERISVRSSLEIPSSQRQRILERDGFRCKMCGRAPEDGVVLHVDHLVTRDDCVKYGIGSRNEINDDSNLAATCDECNLGHGSRSIAPVALLALSVRIAQKRKAEARKAN